MGEILDTDLYSASYKELQFLIHEKYKKLDSQCIYIYPSDLILVQDLLTHAGIPWYKAVGEAERTCSWLCINGYVKAVLTTDSDVLVYGTPIFINDINPNAGKVRMILHSDVLNTLGLSESQFLDFCIMCGTDYNTRIPGIGPVNAHSLIACHGCIDTMTVDTTPLDHLNVRSLFTLPPVDQPESIIENFRMKKFEKPNESALMFFLLQNNSIYTVQDFTTSVYKPKFTVQEF